MPNKESLARASLKWRLGKGKDYYKNYNKRPDRIEYLLKFSKTPNYNYSVYKRNASRRGILFDLTMDQFMEFWQKPCSYCGEVIDTVGLDRVDNSTGYTYSNIKPCCTKCNVGKLDMTEKEYLDHCSKVHNMSVFRRKHNGG